MFQYFYASTKDRKNQLHSYKLVSGETVPTNHEIIDLSIGSRFKFSELIGDEAAKRLKDYVSA